MSNAYRVIIFAIVVLIGHSRISHAEATIPVYLVEVSDCPKLPALTDPDRQAFGNGFVVAGFSPGSPLFVTALHVIYSCTDIEILRVNCQTGAFERLITLGPNRLIQTWPSLDLAAIRLGPDDMVTLGLTSFPLNPIDIAPATLEKLRSRRGPGAQYEVPATSEIALCPHGYATHVSTVNAGAQYAFLSKVLRRESEDLRGSISPTTMLLTYLGTPAEGASGAPVLMDNRVIGFHEAGFKKKDSGWAVILAGAALANPPPPNTVTGSWPAFRLPLLSQSGVLDDADDEMRRALEQVRGSQNFVSLAAGLTTQPRYARTHFEDSVGSEYRFRYALHPGVWELGDTEYLKLGFYLELDYSRMRMPRTFRAPDHAVVESDLIHGQGWGTGGGIDVRLERLDSFWAPMLSVGGVIGAWFHQANLEMNDNVTGFAGGITSELLNRNPIGIGSQLIYALYGIRASYLFTPTLDYSYTGVGATYTRARDDFALTLALQLGAEW